MDNLPVSPVISPRILHRDRRAFLRTFAATLAVLPSARMQGEGRAIGPPELGSRDQESLRIRQNAAFFESAQPVATQFNNGDEASLPGYIGCFTKGLPHDSFVEVDTEAYQSLLQALSTGIQGDFENIIRGSGMKLINPEASFAFDLEGADSHCLACPPAPAFSSAQAAAEAVELYWQALARDVSFADYASSPVIQAAGKDLSQLSGFQGPKLTDGTVDASTIFRINAPGCLDGPYVSQFLWKPIPVNSTWVQQQYRVPGPGVDFLTDYAEWEVLQSGLPPYRDYSFDPTPRYIANGRALAEWVHYDFLYQAFHNAALILANQGPESILNTNPYWNPTNPYKKSKVQTGFSTFGLPHVCGWLGAAAVAALHAAWYQKWCVHRRLRPEELGGRAHQTLAGIKSYPVSPDLLQSAALATAFKTNGTYLLPQAFPEGCPLHPSYPAGHATVAGACSAVLKAFFDENGLVTDCVTPSADGSSLLPLDDVALTVGGEINKLAVNIAMGRDFAGIHYRSDLMSGFELGEQVAIAMMQDLLGTMTEDFAGFEFTRMDGTSVQINKEPAMPEGPCSIKYHPVAAS